MNSNDNNIVNEQKKVSLGAETNVIFSLKSFIGTIFGFLAVLGTFYYMSIRPTINSNYENQKELYNQQKEFISVQIGQIDDQLNDLKKSIDNNTNAISLNTKAISATNNRFDDLNQSIENIQNSNGSFSYYNDNIQTYSSIDTNNYNLVNLKTSNHLDSLLMLAYFED